MNTSKRVIDFLIKEDPTLLEFIWTKYNLYTIEDLAQIKNISIQKSPSDEEIDKYLKKYVFNIDV